MVTKSAQVGFNTISVSSNTMLAIPAYVSIAYYCTLKISRSNLNSPLKSENLLGCDAENIRLDSEQQLFAIHLSCSFSSNSNIVFHRNSHPNFHFLVFMARRLTCETRQSSSRPRCRQVL